MSARRDRAGEPERRAVETVLGRVHVVIEGTGPPVVLWSSLLMDGRMWDGQVERLRDRYRTIVVDPPGHGASEAVHRTFSLDECADVVLDVLDDLGVERAHLVGNSWGAMVGAAFAVAHPDRIGAAVLMNGTVSAAPPSQRRRFRVLRGVATAVGGIRGPLVGPVVSAFLGSTSRRDRPDAVERVRASVRSQRVDSVAPCVRSVVELRPDHRRRVGSITAPVLVVAGREDATFPVAELREMAACIPGAELVVCGGVAHLAALEDPALTSALVDGFLSRHPLAPDAAVARG